MLNSTITNSSETEIFSYNDWSLTEIRFNFGERWIVWGYHKPCNGSIYLKNKLYGVDEESPYCAYCKESIPKDSYVVLKDALNFLRSTLTD